MTLWCPTCGRPVLDPDAVPMKCAGDHASEFNGFAQLVRVYPDLPVLAPPDENDDQEQTNDDAPARPPQGPRQGGDPKSKAGLKPPP